ncbi:MAG TPA: immune inhibitor A, partial [Prolixibacteraceae bacterium]|nr:immune inhibitor A [Prolixibacteraceae bacterium]
TGIGVICHEFGHSMGAPDYYDTNYNETGDGQYPGTDSWDVMAGGSWNNDGDTPAHHNPYTKSKIFNWATASIMSNVQTLSLRDITTYPEIIQINTRTPNEYFLLENRQLNGFNAALSGHGMIIYHVDGNYIVDHSFNNDINVGEHQGMYVVSAASTTENGVVEDGDINTDACPWPGTGNKTTFDDTTTPNSKSWAGENTDKAIVNIEENGEVITFCLIACDENIPTNFTASAVSSSQIDLSWHLNSNNDPVIVAYNSTNSFGNLINGTPYSNGSSISGGGLIIYKGTNTSISQVFLNPNTTYYYKIWTVMDGNAYSAGINGNATTLCGTTTLPFTETFDGVVIPDCWSQIDHMGNNQIWQFGTTGSFGAGSPNLSDGNYTYLNSDQYDAGNTQDADLITPTIDMSDFSDITISFQHFHQYWSETGAVASFSYSIDNGTSWNLIQQWESTTTNPETFNQIIPALSGQSKVKLKWNYTATYGGGWAIDNISITGTPTVTVPVNFELTDRTVESWETICYNAQNEITVSGNGSSVIFSSSSAETLIAGQSIRFLPGFHAQQGCTMNAYITTVGSFCDEVEQRSTVPLSNETIAKTSKTKTEVKNSIANSRNVKIYPNPSNGWATIDLENVNYPVELIIYNSYGAEINKVKIANSQASKLD